MQEYKIGPEEQNIRLDKIIANIDNSISRTSVQRLIEEGKILVNKKQEKPSYKVNEGDVIEIEKEEPQEIDLKPQEIPIDIIYEDKDILIIDKAKGMVVHPANGNPDGTLVNAIMSICKDSLSGIGGEIRPGIVHRLDKDTSGLVIFAKNEYIQECLVKQMQNNTFYKEYVALLCGNLENASGKVEAPIARKDNSIIERCINSNGDYALTYYELIKNYHDFCLVKFVLKTGRTHQIRLHSQYIGHPILGDTLYGSSSNLINRQALHCIKLSFMHPITKKELKLEAPIPLDMQSLINLS